MLAVTGVIPISLGWWLNVISSVSHFIATSQGPLFPWSSKAKCCSFIMHFFSLVRKRERGTKKNDDSTIVTLRPLSVPGNSGRYEENEYWHPQKAPADVRVGHFENIHFGRVLATFAIFQPLWSHSEAPEVRKFPVPIPQRGTGNFTEVKKKYPTPLSGSVEGSHFFGPVNYMTCGVLVAYSICVCESTSMSGKNLLLMLDTPIFTECENINSTLREEPPKTETFYENLGRSCNLDDSE